MDVPSNLVLKTSVATHNFEESETDRIAKRILKALERFGAFSKRGKSNGGSKAGKGNNTCHKCYKLGHYIKDCPMHKIDYKKYANQDTICWGDSSSDFEQGEEASMLAIEEEVPASDSFFALMTDTDNEEERKLKGDLAKYEEEMVELSVQLNATPPCRDRNSDEKVIALRQDNKRSGPTPWQEYDSSPQHELFSIWEQDVGHHDSPHGVCRLEEPP
ncbi:hypothetical protein FXO38_03539 [Capsicum annuum]|nr:hypothetical protein FXO38_03539 [Capsicum annuum]